MFSKCQWISAKFPYLVQRRGLLANNNGSLVLKVNTEAETGAGVTLFIEIPWCGLSVRSPQSLEASNGVTLCSPHPEGAWSHLPLPVEPVSCWTLAWEVKLLKLTCCGQWMELPEGSTLRASSAHHGTMHWLGWLQACKPQCIENLHRKLQKYGGLGGAIG